jgi:magnesium-transporting ATPase (P-type)
MRVPADCILINGFDIATDESSLTGEPEQMEKSHVTAQNVDSNPDPFLLGKTIVV